MRSKLLDAVRGLAFILMCFDHIGAFIPVTSKFIDKYVFQFIGIVSINEIFIIGSAFAIVKSCFDKQGQAYERSVLVEKSKKRIKKLYSAHMLALIAVLFLAYFSNVEFFEIQKLQIRHNTILSLAFGSVLLFQPMLFHILPMHILLSIALPRLIENIAKFLVPSLILWALAQIININGRYYYGAILPFFDFLAWQFLFILAIYITANPKFLLKNKNKFLFISLLVCLALFIFRHFFYQASFDTNFWFSRQNLGPLRLINTFSLYIAAILLGSSFTNLKIPKILAAIGRESLVLYVLHIIVFYTAIFYLKNSIDQMRGFLQLIVCFLLVFAPMLYLLKPNEKN